MSPPTSQECWAGVLTNLREAAARPRSRSAQAMVAAAEKLSAIEPWSRMFPVLRGSELQLAPLPQDEWHRRMPMVTLRYTVSAERYRGAFLLRLGPTVMLYACRAEELEGILARGWKRLLEWVEDRPEAEKPQSG